MKIPPSDHIAAQTGQMELTMKTNEMKVGVIGSTSGSEPAGAGSSPAPSAIALAVVILAMVLGGCRTSVETECMAVYPEYEMWWR